jgi:hypothetical protein
MRTESDIRDDLEQALVLLRQARTAPDRPTPDGHDRFYRAVDRCDALDVELRALRSRKEEAGLKPLVALAQIFYDKCQHSGLSKRQCVSILEQVVGAS